MSKIIFLEMVHLAYFGINIVHFFRNITMKFCIFLLIGLTLFLSSCKQKNQPTPAPEKQVQKVDVHNAKNSLDIIGTYKGILPCADCEGIETMITLNSDETYDMKTKYLGKGKKVFDELGDYTWKEDGNTLVLEGIDSEPVQYFISENKLIRLDENGNKIEGNLAKNYELVKE